MEEPIEQPLYDFTVVDADGRVVMSGKSMHTEGLAGEGQRLIEGVAASLDTYYFRGAFMRYPAKPGYFFEFDFENGVWFDPRSVEQLKADRWESLKADRQTAIDAGVTIDGSTYSTDIDSAAAMSNEYVLLSAQPDNWTITWTLADNTLRVLNKAEFSEVAQVVMQHRGRCQTISQALRLKLFAPETNTPAEIERVVWPVP